MSERVIDIVAREIAAALRAYSKNFLLDEPNVLTEAASALTALQAERDEMQSKLSAAEQKQERMWCLACGTLTRTGRCDCTKFPETVHKQKLINYADEMNDQLRKAEARVGVLERALRNIADEGENRSSKLARAALGIAMDEQSVAQK